jgi:hypothetical protein
LAATQSFLRISLYCLLLLLALPASAQTLSNNSTAKNRCAPSVPVPPDRWRGEYFANRELRGEPQLVRDDGIADIFFDWGLNSPERACGLGVDDFSVRWTRTLTFAPGSYRFSVTADDGVRLLIDDKPLLNEWHDQALVTRVVDVELTGGAHRVALEYFEHLGSAAIKLNWSATPCLAKVPVDHWKGEYFANPDLSGQPLMVSDDGESFLGFNWGLQPPHARCFTLKDNFAARWTRTFAFAQGVYRFKLRADDGVRLLVDKQLKLDRWTEQMADYVVDVELSAGNHQIVLEYYERYGSAQIELSWEKHPCLAQVPAEHWKGEYFASTDLSGAPVVVRDEGAGELQLSVGKQSGAPGCLDREDFSARWTRKVAFGTGTYRFTVAARERVRVLLDNEKLIDQWQEPKSSPTAVEVTLAAGNHKLVVEYAKQSGAGAVRLFWENVMRTTPATRRR